MCNVVVGSKKETNQISSSQRKLMLVSIWTIILSSLLLWAVFNTRCFSKKASSNFEHSCHHSSSGILRWLCTALLYCVCTVQYCAVSIAILNSSARLVCSIADTAVLCVHCNTVQYVVHAIDITLRSFTRVYTRLTTFCIYIVFIRYYNQISCNPANYSFPALNLS